MIRLFLLILTCLTFSSPLIAAQTPLQALESAALQREILQPGLDSFRALVETSKISEMIARMTASMPADVPRPAPPIITKYWLRGAPQSLIVAEQTQTAPYVSQMIERFSTSLAVELDGLLLPADKVAQRQKISDQASVKLTEVIIADHPLQRVEFAFATPVDLDGAFYTTGLRLPQKQITKLVFDIADKIHTINEMSIQTADGLSLVVEIRYHEVAGGFLPQRIHVTSPDGQVDDLTEITFMEVAGFQLPERMVRILRRPDLQDDLDVTFTDYQVNQAIPEDIRAQFKAIQ